MTLLGALQLVSIAFLGFAVVMGLAASALVRLARRSTTDRSPEERHRVFLLLAVCPPVLAVCAALAVFTPSFLAFFWPEFDHCLVHPGHLHLCFFHPPTDVASPLVLGFGLAVAILLARIVGAGSTLKRARSAASRVMAQASQQLGEGARVLPTEQPLCLTVGVFQPVIVVSKGLVAAVTSEELEAIFEHERAHVRRRDTLMRLIAEFASLFMLPSRRAELLQALDLAAEQSSDEAAALAIGDRVTMAEVILKIERLLQDFPATPRVLAASFGGSGVVERVTALLEPRRGAHGMRPVSVLLIAAVISLFAAGDPFHHLVETVLGMFAG